MTTRFIIKGRPAGGAVALLEYFYTGRSGNDFVSPRRDDAFPYRIKRGAEHQAHGLNSMTDHHGLVFAVEEAGHGSR